MRLVCVLLIISAGLLAGCEQPPEYLSATQIHATVQAAVATAQAAAQTPAPPTWTWTPSPLPKATPIPTAAPPSATSAPTVVPTFTPTPTPTVTPTATSTPLPTRTPTLTLTPAPPKLSIALLGCESGLDITHGLGYVTNAYVRARNLGGAELTNVCLTLNTNGEGKVHPDKTRCIPTLRLNYEVTTILTVDAEYKTLTSIEVIATANPAVSDRVTGAGCRALSSTEINQLKPLLNAPRPMP
jgi:hypothetical protein